MWFNQLQEPLEKISGVQVTLAVAIVTATVLFARSSRRSNLEAFPAVGSSGLFGSWVASFKFMASGIDMIQEGYEKHKHVPFKVPARYGWIVVLSKPEHLEEFRRAPEEELSFIEAANDRSSTRLTLGNEIHDTPPFHVTVIRSQLTRSIGKLYPEIRDEIVTAFEEVLDLRGEEWKSVPASRTIQQVVSRSSNRIFVGLPLCRNADWIDLSIHCASNIMKIGLKIALFPKFTRPLVAFFFTEIDRDAERAKNHLGPIIEERLKHLDERGSKWTEQPSDLISWLIEEADRSQLNVKCLTTRVLGVIFPAINPTSASFTLALFYLAANPRYIQPLREEVEYVTNKEGWSKAALGRMRKIDSFLRECQRMEGVSGLSVSRKALKDFTFSDGTFIPKGTMIGVATRCLHHDENFYENAHVFEPFRFTKESVGRYQFFSTAIDYQVFGYGNHACPGRFLAATNMKTMLAHIVTTYDIKLEDDATRPPSLRFGISIAPDPSARVLFRRRID